jgi:intraflagellar transport protein 74
MGAAAMVDVQVTDRPVTQQGISGMRPQSAGPGRQVQDVTYFVGLLRNKITEITKEVAKLKGDIEQCNKDNATYTAVGYRIAFSGVAWDFPPVSGVLWITLDWIMQLERQYETLIKTVRSLEGDLADYNLAMDKSRTGTVSKLSPLPVLKWLGSQ